MTAPLTLVIANKNYSSWSMRPWVLMRERGIPFKDRLLKFESQEMREQIGRLSPTGLVPVLWEGEPGAGFATWDTLAIAERLHELFPERTNVEFVEPVATDRVRALFWERGVGETLSSGTGASAAAVAAIVAGRVTSPVAVETPAGTLHVAWGGAGEPVGKPVLVAGPVEAVYEGRWLAPRSFGRQGY